MMLHFAIRVLKLYQHVKSKRILKYLEQHKTLNKTEKTCIIL